MTYFESNLKILIDGMVIALFILFWIYSVVYTIAKAWNHAYKNKKYNITINNFTGDLSEMTKILTDYFDKKENKHDK